MKDATTVFKIAAVILLVVVAFMSESRLTSREKFERRRLAQRGGGGDYKKPENRMNEKVEYEEEVGAFWAERRVTEAMKKSAARDNKLLFVHIPKTGGTAIETAAGIHNVRWGACMFGANYEQRRHICPDAQNVEALYPRGWWHVPPSFLPTLRGYQNPYIGAYLFAVVRNPYDRLISEYYYERHIQKIKTRGTAKHMNRWLHDAITKSTELMKGSQEYTTYQNGHLIPQYDYIYDVKSGKRIVKHVILFETMEVDLNALWESYSLPVKFPKRKVNGGHSEKAGFKRFEKEDLSYDTVQLINRVYRNDFYLGNYPMLDEKDQSVDAVVGSNTDECSCSDGHDKENLCCRREFFVAHNHDSAAIRDMAGKFFPDVTISPLGHIVLGDNHPESLMPCEETPYSDCRGVLVTRHWYDALVSGYEYHKSGQECYRPQQKQPKQHYQTRFEHLDETIISKFDKSSLPSPPGNGRNLCEYLQQESEYDGMRLYMEWELKHNLEPLFEFFMTHRKYGKNQHTLFTCYHDLTDPELFGHFAHSVADWLYPGGQYVFKEEPLKKKQYDGQHSTSHTSFLREKLYHLVEEIDHYLYNGSLMASSNEFDCLSEIVKAEKNDEVKHVE